MRKAGFYPAVSTQRPLELRDIDMHLMSHGYGPRLKVSIGDKRYRGALEAVVTVSPQPYIEEGALPPAVGREVFGFIRRHHDILQQLWVERASCDSQ